MKPKRLFMPWGLSLPVGLILLLLGVMAGMSAAFSGCNRTEANRTTLKQIESGKTYSLFKMPVTQGRVYHFVWRIKGVDAAERERVFSGAKFAGSLQWSCPEQGWYGERQFDLAFSDSPDEAESSILGNMIGYQVAEGIVCPASQTCQIKIVLRQATQHFQAFETDLVVYEETPIKFLEDLAERNLASVLIIIGALLSLLGLAWIVRGLVARAHDRARRPRITIDV